MYRFQAIFACIACLYLYFFLFITRSLSFAFDEEQKWRRVHLQGKRFWAVQENAALCERILDGCNDLLNQYRVDFVERFGIHQRGKIISKFYRNFYLRPVPGPVQLGTDQLRIWLDMGQSHVAQVSIAFYWWGFTARSRPKPKLWIELLITVLEVQVIK